MIVGEYKEKLIALSRFALSHVANEIEKAIWFEEGLHEDIRSCVSLLRIRVLYERALMVEMDLQHARQRQEVCYQAKS